MDGCLSAICWANTGSDRSARPWLSSKLRAFDTSRLDNNAKALSKAAASGFAGDLLREDVRDTRSLLNRSRIASKLPARNSLKGRLPLTSP